MRNHVPWWVNEVWEEIPAEMVIKSYKTCGISNALDGKEGHQLCTEEGQEVDDDQDNEFETNSDTAGE